MRQTFKNWQKRSIKGGKVCVTVYPRHYNHEINFESILLNQELPQIEKKKIAGMSEY